MVPVAFFHISMTSGRVINIYLERMTEPTEYDTVTVTGDVKLDDRARTVSTPLMGADEIRMLPRDDAILISGSRKPIKIQMRPYFS
jgi:type IV secretory pathway TraG/TraD family ATPase VirD4